MHLSNAILVFFSTIGATLTIAAMAPPPPPPAEITPSPEINNKPRLNVLIKPPANQLLPVNPHQSDCYYTTYRSYALEGPPVVTNQDLSNWMISTAYSDIRTVTHVSEVDEMCTSFPYNLDGLMPPTAKLARQYSAWMDEFQEWRVRKHDEVISAGEECGERFSAAFMALVATDEGECRTAGSLLFGYTPAAETASGTGSVETTGSGSAALPKETAAAAAGEDAKSAAAAARGITGTGGYVGIAPTVLAGVVGLFGVL